MMSFRIAHLLVLAVLPLLSLGQTLSRQTCSRDNSATIQPNAVAWLGGIISLNNKGVGGIGCGIPVGSMQAYEAVRWVLELLNKKNETIQTEFVTDYYVPGIPLGMMVKNYCDNELTAAASVFDIFPELKGDDEACTEMSDKMTFGIIGGSTSDDAMVLSNVTAPYNIPVVSYEATATQLTMPGMYENFMRTISPDGPLMEVIAQVMIQLKWDFVVIVYDGGSYGRTAYNELHARLVANGICLTAAIMIDDSDTSTARGTMDKVLSTEAVGAVYFGSATYAHALIRAGNQTLPASGKLQWMLVDFPVNSKFDANSIYQRGIISITAASRFIVEFEDHWIRIDEANPSDENPWFKDWYEHEYNCKFIPGRGEEDCDNLYLGSPRAKELEKRAAYQQDHLVESAVMAVYTYARALRTAHSVLCRGVAGICQNLRDMTRETFYNDYLKKVDFTFTADERVPSLASTNVLPYNIAKHLSFTDNGDIKDPSYYIWNFNDIETGAGRNTFKFRRVGSYIGGRLSLNLADVGMYNLSRVVRLNPPPSSPCPSTGCMPCLGLPAETKYYFEQGDVIIHGVFSLHNMGVTPLTCGTQMSNNQFMFLEAMIYAIRKANQNTAILNNINLGGLGMDDCSSSVLSQAFLAQVLRGYLEVMDPAGQKLDPRTIEAYSAAHNTPLTLPLAEAMNMLKRPMVGYRAGGSELDDKNRYPYYLHAMPGIYEEIKAIILMLTKLDWMFVQVVTSDMYYSKDALEVFRNLGSKAGICIVATHNIGHTSAHAKEAVAGLAANKDTPPTVVLLEMHDVRRLLMAFDGDIGAREKVVLIGTTTWGQDEMVVQGLESISEGALTLSLQHSPLDSFRNYLTNLDVKTYVLNPWFKEWFAAVHNCSLEGQGSGASCDLNLPITAGVNFRLFYEVENVINAITAIAHGLHNTLRRFCGTNYNTICSNFINSPEKGQIFLEEIKQVSFEIEDLSPERFRFEGDSPAIPFIINSYSSGVYRQVGNIQLWSRASDVLTLRENTVTLYRGQSLNDIQPKCLSPCLECLYMFNYINYWYIPGDVVLGAVFDIHYAGQRGPFSCGAVRVKNGGLYTEVFNFALQRINSGRASIKLNNVTLGGLAFDGCTNPPRATAIINRVHTGMNIMDDAGNMFMPSQLMSWMTYDSQTTIDAASLLQKLGMPVVSPGATARALDDKSKFTTFFRTIPSDSIVVRGMADFVIEMDWEYVIVLNAPDTSNRESRDLFREYLQAAGKCVVANYEFETDGSMDVIARNIIAADTQIVAVFAEPDHHIRDYLTSQGQYQDKFIFIANRPWGEQTIGYNTQLANSVFFDLQRPTIADFITYLNNRQLLNNDNPWFQDIYQEIFECDLPGSFKFSPRVCSSGGSPFTGFEQDIWTLSTINAVYALAQGVHETLIMKCGQNYNGICHNFTYDDNVRDLIMSNMDAKNFTDIINVLFRFIEREADRGYRMMRYTTAPQFQQEGTIGRQGSLVLSDKTNLVRLYTGIRSLCPDDCLVCSVSDANLQDFTMIPGDIYIVGLFDVHKQGSTPYTCGMINDKHGLPLLEAFSYAIEYVNNKTGIFRNILPGIQLGGIGLDTCKSPSRAANLVANIHSGNLNLMKDGNVVRARRIDAYIGTMDTKSSIRVADILTQLAVPQISYGATGNDLLDTEKYNFFLRSVPADDKQARAMVSYLKKFEYNNIQVVSSFDEIGDPGFKEFKRLALVNRICIKISYLVGERGNMDTDVRNVVPNIASHPDAEVVVLWMKNPLPLLEEANNNNFVSSNFLFIATDKWGVDRDYLKMDSIRNLLSKKNIVIMDVETADIPGYDRYLENKTPDNYRDNPWFREYFEFDQNCHWDPADRGTYPTPCDKSSTIPRSDHYVQDEYVLYVINAVFSAAFGIHKAWETLCLTNVIPGVCDLYRNSGERRQNVMAGLKEVNFTDNTHQPFFFTQDGQSDRGFHIYNITSDNDIVFDYMNVGSYNDSEFLKLDITYNTTVNAACNDEGSHPGKADCICDFPPDLPSRFMKKADENRGLTIVYVGDVHQADPNSPLGCGPINTGVDLQKLLAFFFAIERVNRENSFKSSLKFDGLALDSCTHSLRLGQDIYNVLSGNQLCDSDDEGLIVSPSTITGFVIDKDRNVIPTAAMLSKQKITTVSPTAGSAILNDDFLFPYFLRTRGDNFQTAEVILDISGEANWDYLSVVYTDTLAYQGAKDSLLDRASMGDVCVGDAVALPANATLRDAQNVLEKLSQQVGATAVVLFVEPAHFRLLLQASQTLGRTGRFVWLVPSDWAHDGSQVSGYEQEAVGSILIETRSAILEEFNEYVKSLNLKNRREIPDDWFLEIYESLHKCGILNLENPSTQYQSICSENEVITDDMISQDPSVLHVIISVYAIANGLNNIEECNALDTSACLQLQEDRNDVIFNAIREAQFRVLPGLPEKDQFTFFFDDEGNGNAGYVIKNYHAGSGRSGGYVQEVIGQYSTQGLVDFDMKKYTGGNLYTSGDVPKSNCGDDSVCTCQLSNGKQWIYNPSARTQGVGKCQALQTGKVLAPGDRFDEAWAIILTILAIIGSVISLAIFIYLLVMYPVRGGTSILGFILSFGIILLYLTVFPFIAHVDEQLCGLRRFALGFVYAIVYSALLVKLVDCWRVRSKDDTYNAKYSKLGRPFGLFMVTVFLVLVQVMINAEWLILREPTVDWIIYDGDCWPRCSPEDFYDEGLVLSLVYVMVIIVFSLLLGLVTFSSRKNHRESRWILGIIIVSVPCWVIWCAVSILGDIEVRDAAVAVGLLVNATVMLLLVPVRKLYLLHKYNVLIEEEEEKQSTLAASHRGDYGSDYGRQYDNNPRLHDTGSTVGPPNEYATAGESSVAY